MASFPESYSPPKPSGAAAATIFKPDSPKKDGSSSKTDSADQRKGGKETAESYKPYDPLKDYVLWSLASAILVFLSISMTAVIVLLIVGKLSLLEPDVRQLNWDQVWKAEIHGIDTESAVDWDKYIKGMPVAPKLRVDSLGRGPYEGPPKIAFMFLVRGPMPMMPLWERFLNGSMDRATVYIHASQEGFNVSDHVSMDSIFYDRQIPGVKVEWGGLGMVRAERLLLAAALRDPANQRFVLVSESCIPVRSFKYTHDYLFAGNRSFITSHHTAWRYPGRKMATMIPRSKFRKGSQWVALTRKHAELVNLDRRYFESFAETEAWIPDESYIQTVVPMLDPNGVEARSVSFIEWPSIFAIHPRTFLKDHINEDLIKKIQAEQKPTEETVEEFWVMSKSKPCRLNGDPVPCFLFARKFPAESLPELLKHSQLLGY